MPETLDWISLMSVLTVARVGSLSAAARELGVSQSTMSRRLDALQQQVGVKLLLRTPTGYVLTPTGHTVLNRVEGMEAEALAIQRLLAGAEAQVVGGVTIATVESVGANVVTSMLKPLLHRFDGLEVTVTTDHRNLSLTRREADIALRLAEFDQQEAIVRRVGVLAFGLYAAGDYLAERGEPHVGDGFEGHTIVTCEADLETSPEATRLRELAYGARRGVRANSRFVQLQAVRKGCGLGLLPCYLADDTLVEIGRDWARMSRDLWIGVHRDLRESPRIREVVDHLASELRAWGPVLAGEPGAEPRQARTAGLVAPPVVRPRDPPIAVGRL